MLTIALYVSGLLHIVTAATLGWLVVMGTMDRDLSNLWRFLYFTFAGLLLLAVAGKSYERGT